MEAGAGETRRRALAGGAELWLPAAGALVVIATVGYGLAARAGGTELGATLAPFVASWRPDVEASALPAIALLAAGAALAPRLRAASVSPLRFAAAALGLGLALRLALGAARDGPAGWYAIFEIGKPGAASEYLPALPALDFGARFFLDTFAQVGTSLPVHAIGHPPGLLLSMHWLGIDSAQALAALTIGVGSLAPPLAYLLARSLLDERKARSATLLFVFAPSALLYGVTSADALYASVALLAALPLAAAGRTPRALPFGAAGLVLASFFSYANLAVGAWAALLAARTTGLRRAALLAAVCGAALLLFYAGLHLATGYDPLGVLRSTEIVYREGVASSRPYAFWLFGSPVAFLVALGLPTAWYALRSVGAGFAPAQSLLAVVVIAALLGFTKAETERIYLFLVPLACIGAATTLPDRHLRVVLALVAAQAVTVELLLYTAW